MKNGKTKQEKDRGVLVNSSLMFYCAHVLFSIFILKVCYLQGHLLEKGEVVEEKKWLAEAKGWEDDRGLEGQMRAATFFGRLIWLQNLWQVSRPLDPDRMWLRSVPQLRITCSSTVFLHIESFIFVCPHRVLSFLCFCFLFFFGLSYTFWEIENGRSNLRPPPPHWTLSVMEWRQGLWQH